MLQLSVGIQQKLGSLLKSRAFYRRYETIVVELEYGV